MLVMGTATAKAQHFSQPLARNVGPNPNSGAAGDFNGDGKPDLAVGLTMGGGVNILLGKGDGTFVSSITYNTDQNPEGTAVGDFNKDGNLDVAVENFRGGPTSAGNVSVLLGQGDGQFQPAVNFNVVSPFGLTAVDLNTDGNLDLVTTSWNSNKVSVLLGKGDGTFNAVTAYPVSTEPRGVAVADFNKDGKPDLAVSSIDSNVSLLKGNGDGTFQAAVYLGIPSGQLIGITAGDLNADGNQDLVTLSTSDGVVVLMGVGDGTFGTRHKYYVGANTNSPRVADFDGDAKPDVVVTSFYEGSVIMLRGNGDGTLQAPSTYSTQANPWGLVVSDFNVDGKFDLAVTNSGIGRINILLNSPLPRGARGVAINATATVPNTGVLAAGFTGFDPSQTASSFTALINWGDNSAQNSGTVTADGNGGFNVSGSHTYANAGKFTVIVRITDDSGNSINAISTAVVAQANQSITFAALPDKTFGDADFTVSATASSGLGVSFAASGQCTAFGNSLHLTGAGSCTITASQGGSANFNAAASVSQSFNITRASTTTTVAASNVNYDGNPHGGVASVTGPAGLSQSLTVSYVGRNTTVYGPSTTAPTNVGDYTASASYAGDSNYLGSTGSQNYSIAKGSQTISFGPLGARTYGDPVFNVSATASSNLPVSFIIESGPATISANAVTITGAGTVIVRASQSGSSNYNAAPDVSVSFVVAKAGQTISFGPLPNKTFGDAPLTVNATGGASGNTVTFSSVTPSVCSVSAATVTIVGAGTCTVRASQAGNNNYNAAPNVDSSFTVNKAAATLTLSNLTHVYDGTVKSATAVTAPSNLNVIASYSRNGVHVAFPTDAGAYNVTATINNSNYQGSASGILVIDKATPVITWNPSNLVTGTPLGSSQLNASANVAGTFQYNPPSGTVLPLGVSQLSVTFTPTNTANHTTATKSVQLTVTPPPPPELTFSIASYSVGEGAGNLPIIVTRTGDAAPTVSVNYATGDNAGLTSCNTFNGVASSRCDYATTIGTLRFAAGEMTKTIFVPLVNDSYAEGPERLTVRLSNPSSGASVGSVQTVDVTITDDDAVTGSINPITDPKFFIRQQYIDFLGREPDPVGWQGWQDILNNCPPTDKSCDRISVSSGFFHSAEFQERGYFVYRFYPVALGRPPHYSEFMPDMAKVSGFLSEEEKEANKVAFIQEFMTRPEFSNRFGSATDPTVYVDGLLQTCGIPDHPSRDAWITQLTNGTATRAQVLRALSESDQVYKKFFTESFVVMQYFGYLRRDPDILYLEWIKIMNQNSGDYHGMIDGFINSSEYFQRFGP
jgi:hypothetical protein